MLSIFVDNAAANEQLTVNITSNFPQYRIDYWDLRHNNKEMLVMSCNFMCCIFMPWNLVRHFQRPASGPNLWGPGLTVGLQFSGPMARPL